MSRLESVFPNLGGSGYQLTSPDDPGYNCIAWAAGDPARWWWPDAAGDGYWPEPAPRAETLDAFAAAYRTLGYRPAGTAESVAEIEKVIVYAKGGRPTHAARQLPSGRWTSKLGGGPDIEHMPDDLVGEVYGVVALILERPIPPTGP